MVAGSGPNNASVTLADVSGAVDPSTPTSGAAGASVTIKINLTDPGDFLDGVSSGQLWTSSMPFSYNLASGYRQGTSGTLTSSGSGAYSFTATTNLPATGGTLYYQFGETAPGFAPCNCGSTNTYLVWPNVETGAQPAQIAVIGPLAITSLNPASATAGTPAFTLIVNGTGFVSGSTVLWNGSALSTMYLSGTTLNASVSAGLIGTPGTANVTVSNPGGAVSNSVALPINGATPSILGLNPNTVPAGGPAFTLTVNGAGFLQGSTVQWSGSTLPTNFVSGNQLTASVSASLIAAQSTANIVVVNPGGASSNSVSFSITTSGPTVTSLNPTSSPAGGPAFTLTVSGSGFVAGSVVQWNGAPLVTTFLGGAQLSATVPASLTANPGSASVTVVNPGTAASNAATFTIGLPTPSVSTLSPARTTAGRPAFSLTVSGSGFVLGANAQWNGAPIPTNYVNANQVIGVVPASLIAAPGAADVSVVNLGGATSNSVTLSIGAPLPTLNSLSPSSVTAGGPALTLTVNGSGFLAGSTVVWNSSTLLTTTFLSATQLTAVVPASLTAKAGTAGITVSNPGGFVSNSVAFTITSGLAITTTSPLPPGTVGTAYSQTLTATSGTTPYKSWTVTAGSLPPGIALTTVGGAGSLSGIPTSAGTYVFTVQVTDSANATATKQFTLVINAPTISISTGGIVNAASYAGGSVAPGEIVMISGTGLGPATLVTAQLDSRGYVSTSLAGTQVMFDGVAAPILYTQATHVSVVVPYGVSGKTLTQVLVLYQGQASSVVSMPSRP